jgi:hypothetical protein
MTAPDDDTSFEEHINPATGYVETTAHDDGPQTDGPGPVDDEEDEGHYSPATGYIETTAHLDQRPE